MTSDDQKLVAEVELVAAWLGFLRPTTEETSECIAERRYLLRRWSLHRTSGAPIERFSSYYWTPPDFLHSEEASAMLRDKILSTGHTILIADGGRVIIDNYKGGGEINDGPYKTAIFNAAVVLAKREKEQG